MDKQIPGETAPAGAQGGRGAWQVHWRRVWHRAWRRPGRHWPGQCVLCHAWPSTPLCETCIGLFAAPRPRCPRCALPWPGAGLGPAVCPTCERHPPALDRCVAAVDYAWPWPGLMAQFKFQARTGWAQPLAWLMLGADGATDLLHEADWVVPMPLSPERLAERGYNQAGLLARALCQAEEIDRLLPQGLIRARHTPAQSGLGRTERLQNLHEAFLPDPRLADALRGRHILLIDDVCTTGASLEAAARPLWQAGARRVSALVLARTGQPDGT